MKLKILIFLVFNSFFVLGQEVLNIAVSGDNSQVRAINLKENGVMVLDKTSSGDLNIFKIDTTLTLNWETKAQIPGKVNFVDHYYEDNFLYIILEVKNESSFKVLKFSTSFPAYQSFDLPLPKNFQYSFFSANDRMIVLAGVSKEEPIMGIYDTYTWNHKFINANLKGQSVFQSVDIVNDVIFAGFVNNYKNKNQVFLREFDLDGKILFNHTLEPEGGKVFLSSRFFKTDKKNLIAGNFGLARSSGQNFQPSQGIYISDVVSGQTNYYSFDNFPNLLNFLNVKQQDRIRKKVKKRKSEGGEYTYDYRLHISGLEQSDGHTLLIGEIFEPEFRTRGYGMGYLGYPYSNMYWGRAFQNMFLLSPTANGGYRDYQVFDGFSYREGLVVSLDDEGKVLWDYAFPYKGVKYYELTPHLQVSESGGHTVVVFKKGSVLNVSEINKEGELISENELDPKTLSRQLMNKKSEFTNFDHWYNNVYLNWGVQKASDASVCFIQKIIP